VSIEAGEEVGSIVHAAIWNLSAGLRRNEARLERTAVLFNRALFAAMTSILLAAVLILSAFAWDLNRSFSSAHQGEAPVEEQVPAVETGSSQEPH